MNYILDLDGTLIDSGERHHKLMEKLLKNNAPKNLEQGKFSAAAYMKYKADGNSGKKYLTDCLGLEEDAADQIMTLWRQQIEDEQWLMLDRRYPDTVEFLEWIREEGGNIYYLTARQNAAGLLRELNRMEIAEYPKKVEVVRPENALEEKRQFVERLRSASAADQKKDFYIVGDTENEYRLAEELSLPYSILNRGFRSGEYWDAHMVKSFKSLKDVKRHICGL